MTVGAISRIEPAEVVTQRQAHDVAGEAVAADVAALPGLLWPPLGHGVGHRSPVQATARVVAAVGAHHEQRVPPAIQPDRLAVGERAEVDVEQLAEMLNLGALEPWILPAGPRGEAAQPAVGLVIPAPHQHDPDAVPVPQRLEMLPQPVRNALAGNGIGRPGARVLDQDPSHHGRRGAGDGLAECSAGAGAARFAFGHVRRRSRGRPPARGGGRARAGSARRSRSGRRPDDRTRRPPARSAGSTHAGHAQLAVADQQRDLLAPAPGLGDGSRSQPDHRSSPDRKSRLRPGRRTHRRRGGDATVRSPSASSATKPGRVGLGDAVDEHVELVAQRVGKSVGVEVPATRQRGGEHRVVERVGAPPCQGGCAR